MTVLYNDTDTSAAAAESMRSVVSTVEALVLGEIQRRGHVTCDEIEVALKLTHQCASARIHALHHLRGSIVDSGFRRKTRSGRNAIVWRPVHA